MTYLYFQGEPSDFISKDSILGEFRRSVEVRGSSGHQEQENTRKIGEGTDGHEGARPCTRTPARPANQKSGTAVPWVVRPGLNRFVIFFFEELFIPHFFFHSFLLL